MAQDKRKNSSPYRPTKSRNPAPSRQPAHACSQDTYHRLTPTPRPAILPHVKLPRAFQDLWLFALLIPILLVSALGFLGMLWVFLIMLSPYY